MFYDCTKLKTIYASNHFTTPKNSNNMFTNCDNLIGGQGTKYNSSNTNGKYAHIDGGTANPGYLTDKILSTPKPNLNFIGPSILTYTGNEQEIIVTGFDPILMNIFGNKQTNVGDYTVSVTPKGQWSDGTTNPVTIKWSIIKADPSYTLPTDLKATQGDKLSNVALPAGWKWNNPDTILTTNGLLKYKATFTPIDTNNYNILKNIDLTVDISNNPNQIQFLDSDQFRKNLPEYLVNLYFGTKSDYDLSKCDQSQNIGNGYTMYSHKYMDPYVSYDIYVICDDSKQIIFPEDSSQLFSNMHKLKNITFKHIDTSHVKNMSYMFNWSENIETLDLSEFNTSQVLDMRCMFKDLWNITTLDLSNFNTANVLNMNQMFEYSKYINNLNLTSFNTMNVTDMSEMFKGCNSLTDLNLTTFNTNKVTDMSYMFYNCSNLQTIYTTNKFIAPTNSSGNMFSNCNKLIGEQGTTYNFSHIDATYAHIDGGTSNPGYFSCKQHTWDSGEITTEPTCVNKGIKTFTCTKCNTTKTEDIAALGHSYTAETIKTDALKTPGTCTDKAIYYKSCERCGQVDTDENNTFEGEVDSTNHDYSDWKITKNPTCTETGSKEKTCSRCNDKIIEELSALGHELTHIAKKDATTEEFGNIEYWNCSKCKKNFSDSEGTNEITGSTVILKLAPSIIKGDNQSVTEKEEKALSVTSNASYDDFIEVKVDGTTLAISKYAKAKGSTIITLNSDYVSTLSVGTHTLDVVSKFGTATAHFKVEKKVEITPTPETKKSSTIDKASNGWDDGGPFTTDKCGNVFDRWNNQIYEANGCNVGGYNLVRTSVVD